MKTSLPILVLAAMSVLAGCATAGPEARPYTSEERTQLSLEALNRQALPFDQYVQARARLMRAQNTTARDLANDASPSAQVGRDG